MDLDRHLLAEQAERQGRNFREAVDRVLSMLRHAIDEIEREMARPLAADPDDMTSTATIAHRCEEVLRAVTSAVYNMNLQRLTGAAIDLQATLVAQHALAALKAKQTAQVQMALDGREDDALAVRQKAKLDEARARSDQRAKACQASTRSGVWHSSQCLRPASKAWEMGGARVRLCAVHFRQAQRGTIYLHNPVGAPRTVATKPE